MVCQKFYNILVCPSLTCVYHVVKAVQAVENPTADGSIMAVGALTRCALLDFVCHLKAAQVNVQCSLIQERFTSSN